MNLYVTLGAWKARFVPGSLTTGADAEYLAVLEEASRALDRELGRHFYAVWATRHFDVHRAPGDDWRLLSLPADLLSVTTLRVDQDGDGSYELILQESTDYVLPAPDLEGPYTKIQLMSGGQLLSWPIGPRRVEISGMWGYSAETEPAGTLVGVIDEMTTTVTLAAGHTAEAGDTWFIDDEQVYVAALVSDVATVVREVNGTTAAGHDAGSNVRRRRYPRDIELATRMMATRYWRAGQSGHAGGGMNELGGVFAAAEFPMLQDLKIRYAVHGGVGVG